MDPDLSKQTGQWKKYELSSGVKTTYVFKDKLFFESWYVTNKLKDVPFVFNWTECGLVKPQYASMTLKLISIFLQSINQMLLVDTNKNDNYYQTCILE